MSDELELIAHLVATMEGKHALAGLLLFLVYKVVSLWLQKRTPRGALGHKTPQN